MERREALQPEPTIDTFVRREGGTAMAEAAVSLTEPTTLDADTLHGKITELLGRLPDSRREDAYFHTVMENTKGYKRALYVVAQIDSDGSLGDGKKYYLNVHRKKFELDLSDMPEDGVDVAQLLAENEASVTLGVMAETSIDEHNSTEAEADSIKVLEECRSKVRGVSAPHFAGLLAVRGHVGADDHEETAGLTMAELKRLERASNSES